MRVQATDVSVEYNGLQTLFNRPVRVLLQCGNCDMWSENRVKPSEIHAIICQHCGALNDTGLYCD